MGLNFLTFTSRWLQTTSRESVTWGEAGVFGWGNPQRVVITTRIINEAQCSGCLSRLCNPYFSTQFLNVGIPHDYLSFILQYILSSQSHVLPFFLLIITGCSNSNLYLFQWCLLALDMYLQNPFVEFYLWLLPTSCSFPSNVLFFFLPHIQKSECFL